MQATYFLAMTTSPELTVDDKYSVGWVYIMIIILNMFFNFQKLIIKMIYEAIPDLYQDYKKKK